MAVSIRVGPIQNRQCFADTSNACMHACMQDAPVPLHSPPRSPPLPVPLRNPPAHATVQNVGVLLLCCTTCIFVLIKNIKNSLFLNVWTPPGARKGSKLPVMVWLFGGGFQQGASSHPEYDGKRLAEKGASYFNVSTIICDSVYCVYHMLNAYTHHVVRYSKSFLFFFYLILFALCSRFFFVLRTSMYFLFRWLNVKIFAFLLFLASGFCFIVVFCSLRFLSHAVVSILVVKSANIVLFIAINFCHRTEPPTSIVSWNMSLLLLVHRL